MAYVHFQDWPCHVHHHSDSPHGVMNVIDLRAHTMSVVTAGLRLIVQ